MKKAKVLAAAVTTAVIALTLVGCAGKKSGTSTTSSDSSKTKDTVALITDTGGVDDRSFNQSAWEGLQAWGKAHKLSRGNSGFQYSNLQTNPITFRILIKQHKLDSKRSSGLVINYNQLLRLPRRNLLKQTLSLLMIQFQV